MKSLLFSIVPAAMIFAASTLQGQVVMRVQSQDQDGVQEVQQQAIVLSGVALDGGTIEFSTFSTDAGSLSLPVFGGVGTDMSSLVFNPQVKNELELVDDQIQQLKDIQAEFSKKMKENLNFDGNRPDPAQMKNIGEIMKRMNEERTEQVHSVLLPHQSKRLKQISTQMQMKNKGDVGTLTSDTMAEELGIDDDQKKRLEKRSKEIQADLEKDIAKLKMKAREELLKELSSNQRKQMQEMMGDEFEYKKPDWKKQLRQMRNRNNDDDER